jgi:hypothetical protein
MLRHDADFLKQWDGKGHVHGSMLVSPDDSHCFINIPKNASSWSKQQLTDLGWRYYSIHGASAQAQFLVTLRDPVARWISGIAEYFFLYHPLVEFSPSVLELIFDRVAFDDHTERQVYFLHGLPASVISYFRCDQQYQHRFSDHMRTLGYENCSDQTAHVHVSASCPHRQRTQDIINLALSKKSKYIEQLTTYYALDYQLINSVNFIQ